MKYNLLFLMILLFLSACGEQSGSSPGSDEESVVLVEVDGAPVTLTMLERVMEARGVGEQDHERMRELLEELIRMQAVANAARDEGLAEEPDVQAELRLAEVQTLFRHYINRAQRAEPVTDEAIREAYDRQLEQSGDTQYRIETIAFENQAGATSAIERLQDGSISYDELRAEGQAAGRQLAEPGWIDLSQVPEGFAAELVDAQASTVVPRALESGREWYVVRILDTRALQAPEFERVREGIARSMLQQRRQALVESLYEQAEITPMLPLEETDAESGQ